MVLDIESFPNQSWTWGKWEQNVIAFVREKMMCSVAWKWLGEKKVHCLALPDFPGYNPKKYNNSLLVEKFYKEYIKADVVIAHNAFRFDEPMLRSEFIKNGLKPPPPHKVIDTLRIARQQFKFNSNKLDDLGELLGVGRKVQHEGFGLWLGCMEGNMRSWKKMIRYNIQDVKLLENVYLSIRSWATNHPNLNDYSGEKYCPGCQSKNLFLQGFRVTASGKKQRYQCKDCGKWSADSGRRIA